MCSKFDLLILSSNGRLQSPYRSTEQLQYPSSSAQIPKRLSDRLSLDILVHFTNFEKTLECQDVLQTGSFLLTFKSEGLFLIRTLVFRVALVSGAGSGIGLETSLLFGREGCKVVAVDLNEETAKKCADTVNKRFGNGQIVAVAFKADVAKEDQVQAAVKLAVSQFGRLDIMCQ